MKVEAILTFLLAVTFVYSLIFWAAILGTAAQLTYSGREALHSSLRLSAILLSAYNVAVLFTFQEQRKDDPSTQEQECMPVP